MTPDQEPLAKEEGPNYFVHVWDKSQATHVWSNQFRMFVPIIKDVNLEDSPPALPSELPDGAFGVSRMQEVMDTLTDLNKEQNEMVKSAHDLQAKDTSRDLPRPVRHYVLYNNMYGIYAGKTGWTIQTPDDWPYEVKTVGILMVPVVGSQADATALLLKNGHLEGMPLYRLCEVHPSYTDTDGNKYATKEDCLNACLPSWL